MKAIEQRLLSSSSSDHVLVQQTVLDQVNEDGDINSSSEPGLDIK